VRFADADLIGVPLRVTIGKRLATEGTVEIKQRATGESIAVPLADAVSRLVTLAG
jgi:prolyl-tRNA synthetase